MATSRLQPRRAAPVSDDGRRHWDEDLLGRKSTADFLYRYLVKRYEGAPHTSASGAISFALDSPWGAGKTFFVKKWMVDIENCQHPVVYFDAWKNDLSADPLMGFIATLQQALAPWERKVPKGEKAAKAVGEMTRNVVRKAGRALVPIASVLLKASMKKALGLTAEDLVAAISQDGSDVAHETPEVTSERTSQVRDDVIDKFFETSLEDHCKRMAAVGELKEALRALLEHLQLKARARLPMFIFVDELDRCRPSYAIELLECVKHLFDVPGLCFCVSTNLEQLSASIKVVYGEEFNSRMYLKRFFSFEYPLPDPGSFAFAESLVRRGAVLKRSKIVYGVIEDVSEWSETSVAYVFDFVARAFHLSLRSQSQVFDIAAAASTGVPDSIPVHLSYLFALAAAMHLDSTVFRLTDTDWTSFRNRILEIVDPKVTWTFPKWRDGRETGRQLSILNLVDLYRGWADADLKDLLKTRNRASNSPDFPESIGLSMPEDELPRPHEMTQNYPTSVRSYPQLVRAAGQLRSQ
jgi:hypothetical protein